MDLLGAFLALPLIAWALLARTRLVGWTIAATLLGCDAGWLLVFTGHTGTALRPGAAVMLAVLTPLLLIAGLLADRKFSTRPPRDPGVQLAGRLLLAVSIAANVVLWYGTMLAAGNFTPG